jgi:ATP phosphoribosyltransferase
MSAESQQAADKLQGCETIMDLGFGHCKLQVQVPAKGAYVTTQDLVGKNIGTSFVRLAEEHFAKLEAKEHFAKLEAEGGVTNGEVAGRKLKTKIIELSGSVEAACALGVADGIVDLVGMLPLAPSLSRPPVH